MNEIGSTTEKAIGLLSSVDFLQFEFWGNDGELYALAAIAFVLFWFVLKVIQSSVISRLKKLSLRTKTDIDDTFIENRGDT